MGGVGGYEEGGGTVRREGSVGGEVRSKVGGRGKVQGRGGIGVG